MDRKESNREYMRRRRVDPVFKQSEAERMRLLRKDPEFRQKQRDAKKEYERHRYATDEVYREKERQRKNALRKAIRSDPARYQLERERARIANKEKYHGDPSYRAKVRAQQKAKYAADRTTHQHYRIRKQVVDAYGGRCACCGEDEPLFLEIDHVNGGGGKHFRRIGAVRVYLEIIAAGFPPEFRLLCGNCNRGRQRNGGQCPHGHGI